MPKLRAAVLSLLVTAVASRQSCLDPRDFGAKVGSVEPPPGLYWEVNTRAIQQAVDLAAANAERNSGPTCVSLQGGDYCAGSIQVKSGVEFRVEEGSRILAAVNKTTVSLIHVRQANAVTLAGGGVLYGNAEHLIRWYDPVDDRFEPTACSACRPNLIVVEQSDNVTVRGLRLENSSNWNFHIQASTNVLVDGIKIYGDWRFPNNDGIDPDSSINVTILNSDVDVADDGICPKASAFTGMPLRNLLVRNCTVRSKSHAIKFGSNTDTDMYDIVFDHVRIRDSNGGMSIQQRSGGSIYNVTWSNIEVETRYVAPRWWGNGEWLTVSAEPRAAGDVIGRTYDLRFINITARSENGGLLSGKAHGVQAVTFKNVTVVIDRWSNYSTGRGRPCMLDNKNFTCMGSRDCRPSLLYNNCSYYCRTPARANGFYFENVHGVSLTDVKVRFASVTPRPGWWGSCLVQDAQTSGVSSRGWHCSGEVGGRAGIFGAAEHPGWAFEPVAFV